MPKPKKKPLYFTHDGHPLTEREYLFIESYTEPKTEGLKYSLVNAGKVAGYKTHKSAWQIMNKDYIKREVAWRIGEITKEIGIDRDRLLTRVNQIALGKVKDSFGFEPSFADQLKAAEMLLRYCEKLDIKAKKESDNEFTVTLKYDLPMIGETEVKEFIDAQVNQITEE